MPRPRRYESAAQRQAAYRERQRRRTLEDQLAAVPWPAAWRTELTAFARRHGVAAAREAEDLLQAQFDARPHEPVIELKLSLLDAGRIDTASPGPGRSASMASASWAAWPTGRLTLPISSGSARPRSCAT